MMFHNLSSGTNLKQIDLGITNGGATEQAIFGPTERTQPHRSLFFIVPNRRAETLVPIIRKYVRPGSVIFSDKWAAYSQLGREYRHFVVVHERRFVQYSFFQGNVVVKCTTNHVERLWVEMRKYLRGVERSEIQRRIDEVPYRLWRLSTGSFEGDQKNLIDDLVWFNEVSKMESRASAFRLLRGGEPV